MAKNKAAAAARKGAARKKPVKKTAAIKKQATKQKATAKKTAAKKKTPAKKATAKQKVTAKKTAAKKKTPAKKATAGKTTSSRTKPVTRKTAVRTAAATPAKGSKPTAKQRREYRATLMELRARLSEQIRALRHDSLRRDDAVNSEEDGTDAFDRQFALTLASSEQDALVQVDEALQRLDEGRYGVCDSCGGPIEKPRLKALPFVRNCIKCQSELERANGGHRSLARQIT